MVVSQNDESQNLLLRSINLTSMGSSGLNQALILEES